MYAYDRYPSWVLFKIWLARFLDSNEVNPSTNPSPLYFTCSIYFSHNWWFGSVTAPPPRHRFNIFYERTTFLLRSLFRIRSGLVAGIQSPQSPFKQDIATASHIRFRSHRLLRFTYINRQLWISSVVIGQ